jgi:hypothetical protein
VNEQFDAERRALFATAQHFAERGDVIRELKAWYALEHLERVALLHVLRAYLERKRTVQYVRGVVAEAIANARGNGHFRQLV